MIDPVTLKWMLEQTDEKLLDVLFSAGRIPYAEKEYWLELMPALRTPPGRISEERIAELTTEAMDGIGCQSSRAGHLIEDSIFNAISKGIEEALTSRPEAQPRICYYPCAQHMGLSWTMKVGVGAPPKQVCPICHPPEGNHA